MIKTIYWKAEDVFGDSFSGKPQLEAVYTHYLIGDLVFTWSEVWAGFSKVTKIDKSHLQRSEMEEMSVKEFPRKRELVEFVFEKHFKFGDV